MPATTETQSNPTLINTARDTVTYVVNVVDSVTPAFAKDTAQYFYNVTQNAVTTATNVTNSAVSTAQSTLASTQEFATQKVSDAVHITKNVVTGATSTITSMTPDPVLNLINSTLSSANALRADPVGIAKTYGKKFQV